MFNLLVGLSADGGLLRSERLLEGMAEDARAQAGVSGGDFRALLKLPTLAVPEVAPGDRTTLARVGALERLERVGRDFQVTFQPNARIEPFPASSILANLGAFGLSGEWSLHRTYMSVQERDLYRTLLEVNGSDGSVRPSRRYLNFPEGPVDPDLVVVMMPFKKQLDPVWEKIRHAVLTLDLQCERADSIWVEDAIMDDIVSLLWRARIVITDYTDQNANVFYETGVAHTLGRSCIPIAQDGGDIPFDLRHIRALTYTQSPSGLDLLALNLTERIRTLLQDE